jgi:hypothetical protein
MRPFVMSLSAPAVTRLGFCSDFAASRQQSGRELLVFAENGSRGFSQ